MVKLINEDISLENLEFYVDMLPYVDTVGTFTEDIILPDDEILSGNDYADVKDTRKFLRMYLSDVVNVIKLYKDVQSCWVRSASNETKTGLSNYIDIVFRHPKSISKQDEENYYKYTIRFSDHEQNESSENMIKSIHIVGMKPKNFEKAARSAYNKNLWIAQDRIKKFELEKFGKQITFLG